MHKHVELMEQLKRHEGVETHVYRCSVGKYTIGGGRNIDPDGGIGLLENEIDILLHNDIIRCERELRANFKWYDDLDDPRQDAMINICFNLGITRLLKFRKALAHMKNEDYHMAALEFLDSRWAKQVGRRATELAIQIQTGRYANA